MTALMDQESNLRPIRSRKDRPCDYCRQLKHSCYIAIRGEPCANCTKTSRECTFHDPPRKRRRAKDSEGACPPSRSREHSPSDQSRRDSWQGYMRASTSLMPSGGESSRASSSRSGEFWTSNGRSPRRNGGETALSSFLHSLDEENDSTQTLEDSIDYPSLDAENTDGEESHYLGSRAFAHLVLDCSSPSADISSAAQPNERLQYRQVADPKNPAYFLKNPSRVYGLSNHAYVAEKAYQMVYDILRDINPGYPQRMVQIFLKESLPAFPILNRARLESACFNPQATTSFPYTVLTGVLAHAAAHLADLRPRTRELWKVVLSLEENEYRQPRLQTLQITLLDILGRPCSSPGYNHTSLCRAIGAAQLLGLHRNCDRWKLPKWERSVRKRIWWTLYVFDKWNAFVYGRPSNITKHAVPMPTTGDADPGASLNVFIASCRLSVILDSLLPILGCDSGQDLDHRVIVHGAAKEMDNLDRDVTLRRGEPGTCSYRLDFLGVQVLICRIGLDEAGPLSLRQLQKVATNVLSITENLVDFLDTLTSVDYTAFWAPWSCFHISHTASLVLQTCIKLQEAGHTTLALQPGVSDTLFLLLKRLVMTCQRQSAETWEVAEASLPKLRRLIQSIPGMEMSNPILTEIRSMIIPPQEIEAQTQQDFASAEFPFDFATLLNSAEWLAPGLEWINDVPAPSSALVPGAMGVSSTATTHTQKSCSVPLPVPRTPTPVSSAGPIPLPMTNGFETMWGNHHG